jgi:hypothetical protein
VTADEARDVMLGVFRTAWNTLGYTAEYEDVAGDPPDTTSVWARPVVRHVTARESSLTGGLGTKRFTAKGFVWVQIFAPMGDGSTAGYVASQAVVDAYRDADTPVLFRNVRLSEAGKEGSFTKIDVRADFEYDEVR